jgi:hypothetical protein
MSSLCSKRFAYLFICFVLIVIFGSSSTWLSIISAADSGDWPNCLSSEPGQQPFDVAEHDCKNDPMNVSRDRSVLRTEQTLGLTPEEITFIGCDAAPFAASMTIIDPPAHFQILYRNNRGSGSSYYLAPILHEVGHVYQLKKAGSPQQLAESLHRSVERAELGADFLAGVAAKVLELNPDAAQQSIFLVGSYSSGELGSHGTAAHRASAFRMGYFYQPASDPVYTQYLDFQNNRFAQIKHN